MATPCKGQGDIGEEWSCWQTEDEARLMEPFDHELKLLRATMSGEGKLDLQFKITAFNQVFKIEKTKALCVAYLMERFYTFSSLMRYFKLSVVSQTERRFGRFSTLNSALYSNSSCLMVTQEIFGEQGTRCVLRESMRLERGSSSEQYWRDARLCPPEEEYLQMILNRNCSLYRMCLGLLDSQCRENVDVEDLIRLGDNFGLMHRLQSDNTRLCTATFSGDPSGCIDLIEGRLSLPLIHSYNQDPTNSFIRAIIEDEAARDKPEILNGALQQMKKTKSFEYAQSMVLDLETSCTEILDKLAINGYDVSMMRVMLDLLVKMHRCPYSQSPVCGEAV